MSATSFIIDQIERGRAPDWVVRAGIRRLCRRRLRSEARLAAARQVSPAAAFVERMNDGPIAPVPEKANEQHYEAPAEFFSLVLGRHMKYSGCFWPAGVDDLSVAEAESLAMVCQRAELGDGMDILELGCGWGSLTLWMAEHYPSSTIVAVSNSASQRRHIMRQASERGLDNVQVITADMNDFDIDRRFDRIVSVEMFEHMRNYRELLGRIADWLRPDGKLFVHIFCHRSVPYAFEARNDADWMSQHFFTGGIMPSFDLLPCFDADFKVARDWWIDGTHYRNTAEAWLRNMDRCRPEVLRIMADVYGPAEAGRWLQRWRIFFMACAELFGLRHGREWGVGHYLLEPKGASLMPRSERGNERRRDEPARAAS